jgi:hypothetical protein
MASIDILGHTIPIEFTVGRDPKQAMDETAILAKLGEMAELINAKPWPDSYTDAFRIMNKIVFFEGAIVVDGYETSGYEGAWPVSPVWSSLPSLIT